LLGTIELDYTEVLDLGKGDHWLPLKYEKGLCAGEILVSM
jgi:hypothetical protein